MKNQENIHAADSTGEINAVGTEVQPSGAQVVPESGLLNPGEKVFTVILFLTGAFFFYQALTLWNSMPQPRASSAAALPIFTSGIWTLLSLVAIIENIRKKTSLSKHKSIAEKLREGVAYVFPKEVMVIIGGVVLYCALLFFGVNFFIVSSLFLYGSICYLRRRGWIINIILTAIFMGFIYVVFTMLFNVVFP